ncbi:MAG: hypothetical protein V3S29_10105 [bacterium]
MDIETYFGFFSQSVFTAIASSLGSQTGAKVTLDELALGVTNALKLRTGQVETVLLPRFARAADLKFVLALTQADSAALAALAAGRFSRQKLMELAVASAMEPFNFIAKTRNALQGLQFSRNVTGLTAHHLDNEVAYSMATARLRVERGQDFSVRLLVTPAGRDLIEERTTQPNTQRALFSINEGAYLCRPQWEPPPPPPGAERGDGLSAVLMNDWLQTFFALNDGQLPAKVFKQPAALYTRLVPAESLLQVEGGADGVTAVRLLLNGEKELETIVLVPAAAEKSLLTLSKSGQPKFLGDFFRAFFGEAAELWGQFGGEPLRWRVQAVGRVPRDGMAMVTGRLKGGGLAMAQEVRLDEGRARWWLALSPHTWRYLLLLTARAMEMEAGEPPQRKAIFAATGWGGTPPWSSLVGFCSDRDLQDLIRQLGQAGIREAALAAVSENLSEAARERWLAAMPVMLRERTEGYELEEGEAAAHQTSVAEALIVLNRARKIPEGKLSLWIKLDTEMRWGARQALIDKRLPLRHLVYGLDRSSLSRLLFDEKNDVLADLLCGAEFSVLDQVRRAISPGYAVRLLEDIAIKRPRTSAYGCQQAQLAFYRRCQAGMLDGRYLVRATVAERLGEICRWLDEPD